ncbi:amino acid adenylation domain-containing protein [Roseivirga sp. BDSF3-8]|uniref:non-ribosomal peptide synthetase n=1 Tax=Roseivirga sp. BDSF3-8 TaxID=3241598 RepID=UPI003532574D
MKKYDLEDRLSSTKREVVESRNYWISELAKFESEKGNVLFPPSDERGSKSYPVPPSISERIQKICKGSDVAMLVFMLASVQVLKAKYLGENQVLVGIPRFGSRESTGLLQDDVLPLRGEIEGNSPFKALVGKVQQAVVGAKKYGSFDFNHLEDEIKEIVFRQHLDLIVYSPGVHYLPFAEQVHAPFKIGVITDGGILKLKVDTACQDIVPAGQFADHFLYVLDQVTANPEVRISDIRILNESEASGLLSYGLGAKREQEQRSVFELMGAQADLYPDADAVLFEGTRLSHRQLKEMSEGIAAYLTEVCGITKGDYVVVNIDRGEKLVPLIAGIWKAGAIYVPVDGDPSNARNRHIIDEVQPKLVIGGHTGYYEENGYASLDIAAHWEDVIISPKVSLPEVKGADVAYIIYTSGSTGKPKGTVLTHANLGHFLSNCAGALGMDNGTMMPFLASIAFDISIFQIFAPIVNGGSVRVLSKSAISDTVQLAENLKKTNTIDTVPALYGQLCETILVHSNPEAYDHVHHLYIGGDLIQDSLLAQLNRVFRNASIVVTYGPTEGTVFCTWVTYSPAELNERTPKGTIIGRPMPACKVMVLDLNHKPLPIGADGEIYIGGPGVAAEYLNNEARTSDSFLMLEGEPVGRFYRTGDLGRVLSGGLIEFRGRKDSQVKIRGHRIELGEIESGIGGYNGIKDVVVIAGEVHGEKQLIAYYTSTGTVDLSELKAFLKDNIPAYMMPAFYVQLDNIPLNVNGKVDRKALPAPELNDKERYYAPETNTEKTLTAIWAEILKLEPSEISATANFFELGGHSLRATILANKIHQQLQVKVPIKAIFLHQDIRSLGGFIDREEKSAYTQIPEADIKPYYELSSAQRRMYFLYQFDKESTSYNMPQAVRIRGKLDTEKLSGTFARLLERHESLRTTFETVDDRPVQKVAENLPLDITFLSADEQSEAEVLKAFIRPFDLTKGPLIRVGVLPVQENEENILIVDMHHIISDGVSQGIFIDEFMSLYNDMELPACKLQYKDYAEWQQSDQQQEVLKAQKEFWLKEFQDVPDPLRLPYDYDRPNVKSDRGNLLSFDIDEETTRRLKEIAARNDATMYMVLLSAFYILLSKLSGHEDVVVGTPVAGRHHDDLDSVIGLFVNTLAIRAGIDRKSSYSELLADIQSRTLSAFANQTFQYEELIDLLKLDRQTNRNPLFDVMFAYDGIEEQGVELPGLEFSAYDTGYVISKFDLSLNASEASGRLHLAFEYSTDLFKEESVARFAHYFKRIIESIATKPQAAISDIDILPREEKNALLELGKGIRADYPRDKTLIQLFEKQVLESPGNVALSFNDMSLTYGELNERANQIAHYLMSRGVMQGSVVGLMTERSSEMVTAMIGILKAGAAYLPLDVSSPAERISFLVRESKASLLLSNFEVGSAINDCIEVVDIHSIGSDYNTTNLEVPYSADDIAYIIYTSGSTGTPKGVQVPHRPVVNLMYYQKLVYDIDASDNVLLFANIVFDASVEQLWMALLFGATTVPIEKDILIDGNGFNKYIAEHNITYMDVTPSFLENVEHNFHKGLKWISCGGEASKPETVRKLSEKHTVCNAYGPTETTITSLLQVITDTSQVKTRVPIGRPVQNTEVYVLGPDMELLPSGVAGELYIGGESMTRGYINNPELNAQKFVANPFREGEKMYRSGDLVRWLPEGNLDFLGRIDNQVKIRGFRIELGEVETHLSKHTAIKDCVVLAIENDNDKALVAYYTQKQEVTVDEVRQFLSDRIPSYMVPSAFVPMEKFPLSASGKINRKLLPEPQTYYTVDYVAPATDTEKRMVNVWSEVLKLPADQLSTTTNFFEAGGHSLKATVLTNKILREFNTEVPLKAIFTHQDLRSLATFVDSLEASGYSGIEKADKKDHYAVSSAQQRMYFLQRLDPESLLYNMPQVLKMEGDLDEVRLLSAFKELVKRHDILRTRFEEVDDELVQLIDENLEFEFDYYTAANDDEAYKITEEFVRPFDLKTAPLLRAGLVRLGSPGQNLLMVDMHHIITDGVSQGIIVSEFMQLYEGVKLPEVDIQYKDYAERWHSEEQQAMLARQQDYWLQKFTPLPDALNLPTDYVRPQAMTREGGNYAIEIDSKQTKELKGLVAEQDATMFMVLFTCFNVLLSKISNTEDVVVGAPVAGRVHPDLEQVIGMFVNVLPLRNSLNRDQEFARILREIRQETVTAFDNQSYPFDSLVEALDMSGNAGRNPLFDVMFSFQNFESEDLQIPGLTLSKFGEESTSSKFDLMLTATDKGEVISLNFNYSAELFHEKTIERLAGYFLKVIEEVIKNPSIKIADVSLASREEELQILTEFNDTTVAYPQRETIGSLFEKMADASPSAIAISTGTVELTYEELNHKANQVAHLLQRKGVSPEERVGILAGRSIEAVIATLGIVKAGGAYLPLDPDFPIDRHKYMLQDGGVNVVLSHPQHADMLSEYAEVLTLGAAESGMATENLISEASADSMAYVIYTSGSTGQPKGVCVLHHNVTRLVCNPNYVELNDNTRILQTGAPVFDATTFEIWGALLNGGRLYLAEKDVILKSSRLERFIQQHAINTLWLTSSLFDQHVGEDANIFSGLTYLLVGGDALTAKSVNKVRELHPHLQVINGYGPTENTTFSVCHKIDKAYSHNIPIGRPISNSTAYIFSKGDALQPIGIPGELIVGGDGVSRGYLNQPELTREKFIDDPFSPGKKMYRTGDLARWLENGTIEFLGRIDKQVKMRGYRIEPGEIETVLNKYEGIRDVVVTVRVVNEEDHLVAYYVSDKAIQNYALKAFLSDVLPDYMVPSFYVYLETLPLTSNGKTDYRALPDPELSDQVDHQLPATEMEEKLLSIWADVLKLDAAAISVTTSFFELGGHSLRATVLVNKILKQLQIEVPLRTVFTHQDIRKLAGYVESLEKSGHAAIPEIEKKKYYVMSSAQQRMYFLQRFDPVSVAYNMPQVIRMEGDVDQERLAYVFKALIQRHDILRTIFVETDEGPRQQVLNDPLFQLEYYEATEEEAGPIISDFTRPFDLEKEMPIRAGLIKLTDANHNLMMVDMHHVVSDGISQDILSGDFTAIYEGKKLPKVGLQYKDYAVWQHSDRQQKIIREQKAFWMETFADLPAVLDLPTDYSRPVVNSHKGGSYTFELSSDKTRKLKKITQSHGATLFTVLLSAYQVLLSKLSGQNDLVIGIPVAGRYHPDLEQMVGMFVNTIPFRRVMDNTMPFAAFMEGNQKTVLSCFENQAFQYEELIDALKVERNTSRNPLFDVTFNYQDFEKSGLELSDVDMTSYGTGPQTAKFDLSLTASGSNGKTLLHFGYSTDLFKDNSIERFAGFFTRIIDQVIEDHSVSIKNINLLSQDEQEGLLDSFKSYRTEVTGEIPHVLDRFRERASGTPESMAISSQADADYTYGQLLKACDGLASYLVHHGDEGQELCFVLADSPQAMAISVIGVMTAGKVVVPVGISQPEERILDLIEAYKPGWVIVDDNGEEHYKKLRDRIRDDSLQTCRYDLKGVEADVESRDINLPEASADRPCYIYFTSGSTGKPKAILGSTRGLNHFIHWETEYLNLEKPRVSQFTSPTFDAFLRDLFLPLCNGGVLCLPPRENGMVRTEGLAGWLVESRVNVIHCVPTLLREILQGHQGGQELPDLQYVLLSGETLYPQDIRTWQSHFGNQARLVNMYGASETTMVKFTYEAGAEDNEIPIGKPMSGSYGLVLNEGFEPCFPGQVGELYISTRYGTLGYYNDEERTAASFVRPDWLKEAEEPSLYKTGDLAYMREDGNLMYVGRKDHQVKINGVRVELGEIETHLRCYQGVEEAVVCYHESEKVLSAALRSSEGIKDEAIMTFLHRTVPVYMIPTVYEVRHELPRNRNGKLDRKQLKKELQALLTSRLEQVVAPSNKTEKELLDIWYTILKAEPGSIGVRSGFFDVGGNSLKANLMAVKIRKVFEAEIPLVEIFKAPTVEAIAARIEEKRPGEEGANDQLVLLNSQKNDQDNLFMIHDIGGDVNGYIELANSMNGYTCYGIRRAAMHSYAPAPLTIEQVAADYIAIIKQVQPEGPYHLAGWSLGGIIGYEMVRQLEAAGEKVASLALIDSRFRNSSDELYQEFTLEGERETLLVIGGDELAGIQSATTIEDLWAMAVKNINSKGITAGELLQKIPESVKRIVPALQGEETEGIVSIYNAFRSFKHALEAYRVDHEISAPAIYIKASETVNNMDSLQGYFKHPVTVSEVEGDHLSILKQPAISHLSEVLNAFLDRSNKAV